MNNMPNQGSGAAAVPVAGDSTPAGAVEGDAAAQKAPVTAAGSAVFVAGVCGSAGAVEALRAFFQAMPDNPDMAFIVVIHLSPDHASSLPEVLQRHTRMPVVAARGDELPVPNHVYVIPPGKLLTMAEGRLLLTALPEGRGKRATIDLFLRTLADSYGARATGILLSGGDADGASGLQRIKERGGLTVAQDPGEALHSDMPRAAIATAMVDWVLGAADIPPRLVRYRSRDRQLAPLADLDERFAPPEARAVLEQEWVLREILLFLRARTGRDFTYYKQPTIARRVMRRLQVNEIDRLDAYLDFLRTHPGEAIALVLELLISVTNFFRDPPAFSALAAHMPSLFRGKSGADVLRIWVPGCATGEEAYSIAIVALEHAATLADPPAIQIFASDLDANVIRFARQGFYSQAIEADVSADRLQRFFLAESQGYRLRRDVRESVLFAAHDMLNDPPFSRVDLISCRNLLIYLDREAQSRAFDIFDFALIGAGLLFLGSSELVDPENGNFVSVDKVHRLYRHGAASMRALRSGAMHAPESGREAPALPAIAPRSRPPERALPPVRERESGTPWGALHLKLIESLAPPSLLVDSQQRIVHLSEGAGRFLQFPAGQPTRDVLRSVDPMLRTDLRAALHHAVRTQAATEVVDVPLDLDGKGATVIIRVTPATDIAAGCFLVTFEAKDAPPAPSAASRPHEPHAVVRQLEEELETVKAALRDTVEEYEGSTQELKVSNEELQAINEELRSATEELETGREELQSINEELTTVNSELKSKVEDLAAANSDLHNLMSATSLAIVFLDHSLRVMRYTPPAVSLFNFIPGDVGRPLTDLSPTLVFPELERLAQQVMHDSVPIEREIPHEGGLWFLVRILPYYTAERRVAGVVLTFLDISERRHAAERLRESEERFRSLAESSQQILFRLDPEWREIDVLRGGAIVSPGVRTVAAWLRDSVHPEDRQSFAEASAAARAKRLPFALDFRLRRDAEWRWVSSHVVPRTNGGGVVVEWFGGATDISDERNAVEALRSAQSNLARTVEDRTAALNIANATLKAEIAERRKSDEARRTLFHRLVGIQEEERRRIARELHDLLGQHLTALDVGLKAGQQVRGCPREVLEHLEYLRTLTQTVDDEVDRLSYELRPRVLDDLGLADALKHHVEEWTRASNVPVDLHLAPIETQRLPPIVEITLYRVIQEALTNVLKHAQAQAVSVIIERRGHEVLAIIEDDGRGFDDAVLQQAAETTSSVGLRGMEERVVMAGGRFSIESHVGSGTSLYIHLPID
jgi:two-component system, chemotaxis family, CheB/CheR fusion protein